MDVSGHQNRIKVAQNKAELKHYWKKFFRGKDITGGESSEKQEISEKQEVFIIPHKYNSSRKTKFFQEKLNFYSHFFTHT